MSDFLNDNWIPENITTTHASKPLVEREWIGTSMTCHVNVRLKNDDPKAEWRHVWRQVEAPTLREAMAIAERMPDVAMCVEASTVPGGVVT